MQKTVPCLTTDEHLQTPWQLKARGEVVQEVPAIYGPSADDKSFR